MVSIHAQPTPQRSSAAGLGKFFWRHFCLFFVCFSKGTFEIVKEIKVLQTGKLSCCFGYTIFQKFPVKQWVARFSKIVWWLKGNSCYNLWQCWVRCKNILPVNWVQRQFSIFFFLYYQYQKFPACLAQLSLDIKFHRHSYNLLTLQICRLWTGTWGKIFKMSNLGWIQEQN